MEKGDYDIEDLIKQSSLLYARDDKILLNYYSSPVQNCVYTIAMT
jgi:hypothetical protein